jgi:hypothetical protein
MMPILSQGTEIFYIDPEYDSNGAGIREVECATNFVPGGNPSDQIEVTCLEETSRTYIAGLRTPGQAQITINADPAIEGHVRLSQLANEDPSPVLKFAIGWSDGTSPPALDTDEADFSLPTDRTWYVFEGYVADFPFDMSLNTAVTSQIPIQRSGAGQWIPKSS